MRIEDMRRELSGVFCVTVTPFKPNYELDIEGVRANARFLIDNGISEKTGMIVPGAGGGEGVYLSIEEHRKVVETVMDEVGEKAPVFPGVNQPSSLQAAKYCKELQDMGIRGVQLHPPSPYFEPCDDDVVRFYQYVSEAADNLGIIVYNAWWQWGGSELTGKGAREMTPELIERLLAIKNVVGIKWGTRSWATFSNVLKQCSGKGVFVLNQEPPGIGDVIGHMLGAKFILGEDFAPWHRLKIWNLFEKRDYAKAWDEMKRWEMPFHELTMEVMSHGGHWIALSKALAEFSGVAGGHGGPPRPPQRPLTAHEKEKLKRLIDESGILLEKKSV